MNSHIHSANECVLCFFFRYSMVKGPYISLIDISNEFSFDHMLEFSRLAVAFAIELGELSN